MLSVRAAVCRCHGLRAACSGLEIKITHTPSQATRAYTGRPSVQTAGGAMGRGQMPALSSERPASQPGGGGHHPRHVGRGGLPVRPSLPRQRPRSPREGREWARRRSRRGKREGRLRLLWRRGSRRLGGPVFSFLFLFAFLSWCAVFFSFCLAELGGRRSGSPARTDHFGLGRDLVKGGKMGRCHSPSGHM